MLRIVRVIPLQSELKTRGKNLDKPWTVVALHKNVRTAETSFLFQHKISPK